MTKLLDGQTSKRLRARFKNTDLDSRLEKDGYVVIKNWANSEQIKIMRAVFDEIYQAPSFSTNIWNTLIMADYSVRKSVSDRLMEQLKTSLERDLIDFELTFGYFLTKPVDIAPREVVIHSDSSAVNESKYEYLALWLPLVDVNKENGCIYMIPESQKLFTYEQPFAIEWPYPNLEKELKRYAIDLPMKAGDLLIFSGKTLHGSYPNKSNIPRPVVGSGLIYPNTEMWFNYFDKDEKTVNTYLVDLFFYFRNQYDKPKNNEFPFVHSYTFSPPEITEKEIKAFYKNRSVKRRESFFEKLFSIF